MELLDRSVAPGPKRVLALDGGGICGVITLGLLARIESILRERDSKPYLVLADYFGLIGGTSTGSIIAAALAIGTSVEQVRELYLAAGDEAFGQKLPFYERLRAIYDKTPLERLLQTKLGDTTLGDPELRTGLCIVAKRADTNSTWPLHNHPRGRYFEANRRIPLWQAVRASTAAPSYFTPELMEVPDRQGQAQMVGFHRRRRQHGLEPRSAALLSYGDALQSYAFRWETGADKLLLVSVGTGIWERRDDPGQIASGHLWDWARPVPGMFMDDSSWQARLLLLLWSNSPTPWVIDREIGDLRGDVLGQRELLSYVRYDVRIEPQCLRLTGFDDPARTAEELHEMDNTTLRHAFDRIGQAVAARTIVDGQGREIQFGVIPRNSRAASTWRHESSQSWRATRQRLRRRR
jgi:hypothetical protein